MVLWRLKMEESNEDAKKELHRWQKVLNFEDLNMMKTIYDESELEQKEAFLK